MTNPDTHYVCKHDVSDDAPYANGDFTLLSDVATWLLTASHEGQQQWLNTRQEETEDALRIALELLHFNPVQLATFKRLLREATRALMSHREWQAHIHDAAQAIDGQAH